MVEHDEGVLREYIAWALDAIGDLMDAIGNVEIIGRGRTFETPAAPWIDGRFFDLAEEMLDPNLPADRLLEHALGLEDALLKLRVAVTCWLGRVVGHAAGLNRRPALCKILHTSTARTTTLVLAAARVRAGEVTADPTAVPTLVLVAPNAPPGCLAPIGSDRAA